MDRKTIQTFFENDINLIQSDPEHPLYKVVNDMSIKDENTITIKTAFESILNSNDTNLTEWLKMLKPRLLHQDKKGQISAVAEIVACYSLCAAGFEVSPIQVSDKPTPDFLCKDPDGGEFMVEVYSRNMSDNAIETIQKSKNQLENEIKKANKPGIYTNVTEVRPWGNSDDTCTEDAISKVCSIKQNEHQYKQNIPFIIWVDLGITGDVFLGGIEYTYPLISFAERITSGHYWYGLYGKKDFPVFTDYYVELGYKNPPEITRMKHDGRFFQSSNVSAMIFRFERDKVLFENPNSNNIIKKSTRIRMLNIPGFNIEHSLADFFDGMINKQNSIYEEYIKSFLDE